MTIDDELGRALGDLEERGLLREPPRIDGAQGPLVEVDGRSVICLSSNNYLGLASDPRLVAAARDALANGVGAGASRLISGTMRAHTELEAALARFTRRDAALAFSTGWAANVGMLQSLAGPDDVIFSDALNHASLIDGARLSRARVVVYRHGDTSALESLVARERPRAKRALVITDAVFSMDADRAPLGPLRRICDRHDAWLVVDEAHSLFVLGPGGRGACAEAGVSPEVLVGTLGKGLGVAGAFVAGSETLVRFLSNRARSFVFSTAPPPATAATARAAIELAAAADGARARVLDHARRLRAALRAQGWDARGDAVPIVPIVIGDATLTMRTSRALLERGVLAHGIRPPTVPEGTSRIRAVAMATHEDAHIDHAIDAFSSVRRELFA